jgi:hypothetical protein
VPENQLGLSVRALTIANMADEQLRPLAVRTALDPYCSLRPKFLGIVDANAVMSSVDNDCRRGDLWQSRLLRMADGGTARLYAPDHVYGEIYQRMPRIAKTSPVALDVLRLRFEERYLPAMRFVDVDMSSVTDPQVLAITDLDDAPTGQLAKLIAPCVVFSEDKHLRKPGFAPPDWRAAAGFAVEIVEGIETQSATATLPLIPARIAFEVVKAVSPRLGLSPWLLGGLLVGGGAFWLRRPERRSKLGEYLAPVVEALTKMLEEAHAQEQQGLSGLQPVLLPALEAPSTKQQVAIVLSRQQEPLLAREVQELIAARFTAELVPTATEVRAALRDGSEFYQPERYRWQFGREARPWRGSM